MSRNAPRKERCVTSRKTASKETIECLHYYRTNNRGKAIRKNLLFQMNKPMALPQPPQGYFHANSFCYTFSIGFNYPERRKLLLSVHLAYASSLTVKPRQLAVTKAVCSNKFLLVLMSPCVEKTLSGINFLRELSKMQQMTSATIPTKFII